MTGMSDNRPVSGISTMGMSNSRLIGPDGRPMKSVGTMGICFIRAGGGDGRLRRNAGRLIGGVSAMIKHHDRVIRSKSRMGVILVGMGRDGKWEKKILRRSN